MGGDRQSKKIINPARYGMVVCPNCKNDGYVQNFSKRQLCPRCGGFGFIKTEPKEDTNISTRNK